MLTDLLGIEIKIVLYVRDTSNCKLRVGRVYSLHEMGGSVLITHSRVGDMLVSQSVSQSAHPMIMSVVSPEMSLSQPRRGETESCAAYL